MKHATIDFDGLTEIHKVADPAPHFPLWDIPLKNCVTLLIFALSSTLSYGAIVTTIPPEYRSKYIVGDSGTSSISIDSNDLFFISPALPSGVHLSDLVGSPSGDLIIEGNLTIGTALAGVDYYLKFDGENNDLTATWYEDEARFDLDQDVRLTTDKALEFRGSTSKIESPGTDDLDIYGADIQIIHTTKTRFGSDSEPAYVYIATGAGYGDIYTASGSELTLQSPGTNGVRLFDLSDLGSTPALTLYGYRTGDIRRTLTFSVGSGAANRADIGGTVGSLYVGMNLSVNGSISGTGTGSPVLNITPTGTGTQIGAQIISTAAPTSGNTTGLNIDLSGMDDSAGVVNVYGLKVAMPVGYAVSGIESAAKFSGGVSSVEICDVDSYALNITGDVLISAGAQFNFGDGDTGFYEWSDDVLVMQLESSAIFTFSNVASVPLISVAGAGPTISGDQVFLKTGDAAGVKQVQFLNSSDVKKAYVNSNGQAFFTEYSNPDDTDTSILMTGDTLYSYAGNLLMYSAIEAADDVNLFNPTSVDIDFTVYSDTLTALAIDGATGATTIGGTLTATGNTYCNVFRSGSYLDNRVDYSSGATLITSRTSLTLQSDSDSADHQIVLSEAGDTTLPGGLTVTGTLDPNGAITGDGGAALSGMLDVVTNDADGMAQGVLTAANVGMLITNASAGGAMAYVLPEASTCIGGTFYFAVMAAQALRVDPYDGTDQILLLTGTAGDYYWADAIGETLTIKAVAADAWVVMHSTGTWTEE